MHPKMFNKLLLCGTYNCLELYTKQISTSTPHICQLRHIVMHTYIRKCS